MGGILLILSILFSIAVAIKVIWKFTTARDNSPNCLVGKTAIVTGANTGIGYYTALDFAKRGAKVILACRNEQKAEQAKERIITATKNTNVYAKILDLSSLASVRNFAKDILETEGRLDILVNNAGASGLDLTLTKDGLPLLMQTNYFGPFLLTILLLKLLKISTPSRIVNVASEASRFANINDKNLGYFPKGYFGFFLKIVDYCNSKFCNVIFTNELSRRLKGCRIVANSLHPGIVYTEFSRNFGVVKQLCEFGEKYFAKTPEEGAQTTIYVAVSDSTKYVSGKYFVDCTVLPMPYPANDKELAVRIWEKTEELVKLTTEEKQILNEL